jgi:hypothetical protein
MMSVLGIKLALCFFHERLLPSCLSINQKAVYMKKDRGPRGLNFKQHIYTNWRKKGANIGSVDYQ